MVGWNRTGLEALVTYKNCVSTTSPTLIEPFPMVETWPMMTYSPASLRTASTAFSLPPLPISTT